MAQSVENRKKLVGEIELSQTIQDAVARKISNIDSFQHFLESFKGNKRSTTEIVDFFLASAIKLDASDIHLEPLEESITVRLRLDGILHDAGALAPELYEKVSSRIKLVAAGIKLNVSDHPQDGRFSFLLKGGEPVEVRVSTLPAEYGEAVVMRVLNPRSVRSLEQLGLRNDLEALFRKEIKKPNGMIVVTGPTGSGKTSTLYAFLREIQSPEIKIITIEDPIEYHIEGISQSQTNPQKGYDFASGLRAIVRQDPDVILVGEMRDKDTAHIALQAALTGHFVFTTLHTNDAAGTFSRLFSLQAPPSLVASALNLVIAQRLVRRVCSQCTKIVEADKAISEKLESVLREMPAQFTETISRPLTIPHPEKCTACNFTGFQGRVGVFEAISVDETMEELILKSPAITEVRRAATAAGMLTMYQDGILKVLHHDTTLEEIERETINE